MSPNDGMRHDRTITQSDTPPPPSAAPGSGEAHAVDPHAYDPADAYDEYGEALYDDDEPLERIDEDEVAGSGWSMWDDEWHDPRHAPSSGATLATGPPARSDAYRTGGGAAVRTTGPPTPSTGQGAAVGAAAGPRAAPATRAGWSPQAVAGVVALWLVCLIGGLVIGSAGGGEQAPDELVTVEPDEGDDDWRDAAVPGGGPVTTLPADDGDRPSQRPDTPARPTTTNRPDVTRPETTTTTERPSEDVTTTTTTVPEETTTTSSSTTTSSTSTTSTTEPPPTTEPTVAGANALRSFLPF